MKLSKITICGMNNIRDCRTYEFDSKSAYLFGKNGAGKSTVLKAIMLAILGYIPGEPKTNGDIFKHCNNGTIMSVEATFDSGETVKRTWSKSGSTVSSKVEPKEFSNDAMVKDIELPIFNFEEFRSKSANSIKDWFISFLPSESAQIDWKSEFENCISEMHDNFSMDMCPSINTYIDYLVSNAFQISESIEDGSATDVIGKVNAFLKDEKSCNDGAIKQAQATINSLIHYDDVKGSVNVDELSTKISEYNNMLAALSAYKHSENRRTELLNTIEMLSSKVDVSFDPSECDRNIIEISEKMKAEVDKVNEYSSKLAVLRKDESACSAQISTGKGICPYTRSECETATKFIAEQTDKLKTIQSEIEKVSKEIVKHKKKYNQLESDKINEESRRSNAVSILAKIDAAQSELAKLPTEAPTSLTSDEISKMIASINDTIVKYRANQKYEQLTDNITSEKFENELKVPVLKALINLTGPNGSIQSSLVSGPFTKLSQNMDEFLIPMFDGDNVHCKFNLSEKSNSFSFGMTRDDAYVEFEHLSSGEKCLYMIALFACIIANSNNLAKVVAIDDSLDHLDSDKIKVAFEKISKLSDVQFVLAGVAEPSSEIKVINI